MLETVLMVTDKFKTTSGIILKPKKNPSFYPIYPDLCLSSSIGREKKKSDETRFFMTIFPPKTGNF